MLGSLAMELAGQRLAVTGAGGYIGLRLVTRARALGLEVRGLEASPAAAERARAAGAEVIVGDVGDPGPVAALCAGAAAVVHTAAIVAGGGDLAKFRAVNVEGTRAALAAAAAAGAKRFVHLSSVMVYGYSYPPFVDETGPQREEGNAYCTTKIESERLAFAAHRPGGMEVVILRPGDVYGPGSPAWVVGPIEAMRKRVFALPDGGKGVVNHLHVDNLVDAIFLALTREGVGGEAYNLTDGQATTWRDFYGRIATLIGKKRVPSLPTATLVELARKAEEAARARGEEPEPLVDRIMLLTRPHAVSIEKAKKRLGYAPRIGLEEGMAQIAAWLAA